MPIFTHRYIREKAEELFATHIVSRPPVDVRKIGEGLGIEIVEMTQDLWFYGMLLGYHDSSYIVVNKVLPEQKKRFTIAHELGHYVLHRQDMTYTAAKEKEYLHREANIFAAELCMPARLVKRLAGEWNNDHRILAEMFDVSETAMLAKMDELGLVRKRDFHWNYTTSSEQA